MSADNVVLQRFKWDRTELNGAFFHEDIFETAPLGPFQDLILMNLKKTF